MKVALIKTSVLIFIFGLSVISCDHSKKDKDCCETKAVINPEKVITKETAQSFYNTYTNGNYALVNENREKPDSRSFWYSVEDLEGYIEYVKQYNKDNEDSLGIRLYIGTYPADYSQAGTIPGNQNIFLGPSYVNNDFLDDAETSVASNKKTKRNLNTLSLQEEPQDPNNNYKYYNLGNWRP